MKSNLTPIYKQEKFACKTVCESKSCNSFWECKYVDDNDTSLEIYDKIIMSFKFMGLVSDENCVIKYLTDIVIETNDGFKFNRKTGKCLNDNNFNGAIRFIKKENLI